MNEFYVERVANEKGENVVHKGNCPSLPEKHKMHYIGVRTNSVAPLKEAATFWASQSIPCPVCLAS
jgi:hypothetical protein